MPDTLDAWETASEQAEIARREVAEAALRHVATSVLEAIPDAVFLEVSFGSFGDGLVAESVHVDGEAGAVSALAEDVHDALDDLNEYNAATWMPFVVDDDGAQGDVDDLGAVPQVIGGADIDGGLDGDELDDADDSDDSDDGPPLLIDLTLVRETLGG